MLDGLAVLAEGKKITFKIWQFHGEKDRYLLCKEWGWDIVLALGKPPPGRNDLPVVTQGSITEEGTCHHPGLARCSESCMSEPNPGAQLLILGPLCSCHMSQCVLPGVVSLASM